MPGERPDHPFRGAGAAYLMIGAVAIGAGLGWMLDRWLDTFPLWLLVCTGVFLVAGFYHMVKEGRK
jgi:F0F1-type ATP synthase assembly protein I